MAETTTLHTPDGLTLHAIRWRAQGTPKGCVLIVHGIGEHSGRYAHVAAYLNAHGYTAYSLDYRGHGRSEGVRADVGSFEAAAGDVKACYDWLVSEEPDMPVFILGHSQGTLVTLHFVLAQPDAVNGVLLSATMLGLARVAAPLRWLLNGLNLIAPNARLIPLNTKAISRDPAVLEAAGNDRLNFHKPMTPHIIREMVRESRHVLSRLPTLHKPILLLHGTGDRLVPPMGSQLIFDAVGSSDKDLIWYEGLYHEILNEPEQDRVLSDIVRWLDAHLE